MRYDSEIKSQNTFETVNSEKQFIPVKTDNLKRPNRVSNKVWQ